MRLFVALPIPARVRATVAAATAGLPKTHGGLRWTRPEGWHLTVAFLGEVDNFRVDEVAGILTSVASGHGPVGLSLGAPGRFGRRVLWVGVDDDPPGTVTDLGDDVQAALAGADLPVKQQPVHAHLTLARAGRAPVRNEVVAAVRVPDGRWVADEVVLWRSRLGGGRPARYEEVASAALEG